MDVKETKMKTQDIKNMGQALQQVQESAKAALAKKLAKASASSEKGKAAVTLPKAPFEIPKKDANEALKGDQHKLDHDDDGDIDAADFKKLRSKKKGEKSEVKPRQETDTDKVHEGSCNEDVKESTEMNENTMHVDIDHMGGHDPHAKEHKITLAPHNHGHYAIGTKKNLQKYLPKHYGSHSDAKSNHPSVFKESTKWPVYARIMEKQSHTAGATAPEEMDSKDSPSAKKMKKDHKPEVNDTEAKGHVDAAEAGRKGPSAKARPNDNMKGDKNVVNPVKGAVTNGSN